MTQRMDEKKYRRSLCELLSYFHRQWEGKRINFRSRKWREKKEIETMDCLAQDTKLKTSLQWAESVPAEKQIKKIEIFHFSFSWHSVGSTSSQSLVIDTNQILFNVNNPIVTQTIKKNLNRSCHNVNSFSFTFHLKNSHRDHKYQTSLYHSYSFE